MIFFLDDILNGNIQDLLGADLYAETVAFVVKWLAIIPALGIVFSFGMVLASLFRGDRK